MLPLLSPSATPRPIHGPTPPPSPVPSTTPVPAPPGLGPLLHHLAGWLPSWPWLAGIALLALAASVAGYTRLLGWRHRLLVQHARQVNIVPPPEVDPASAGQFWATVYGTLHRTWWRRLLHGTPHLAYEYRWTGRALTISVWVPGTVAAAAVAAAARAAWPAATVTVHDQPTPPIPLDVTGQAGGALLPVLAEAYPLRGLRRTPAQLRDPAASRGLDAAAPLRWLLDALTPGPSGAGSNDTARTALRPDPARDRDVRDAVDKVTAGPHWETSIRYAAGTASPRGDDSPALTARMSGLAGGIAGSFAVYTAANRLRRVRLRHPAGVLAARRLRHGFVLSTQELAAIAGLPTDLAVPGLTRARAKSVPAPIQVPTGGRGTITLGRALVGGHAVALPVPDFRYHTHIEGSTGSGKTTQLLHVSLATIKAGRGLVVVDPKGDLVNDILDRLPFEYADKIVLLDPAQDPPPAFNPLEGDDDDLVVDNIVSIFGKIYARHWGPRIDDILRSALLTLMGRANPMLTLVPPLLLDRQLRAQMTASLGDPAGLGGFWTWYDSLPEGIRAQANGPVLARLRAMLTRRFVRRVVGQPHSSFDMSEVLDGGILLCRLPKGVLGDDTARLLGSFVVASVWQAATARSGQPEAARRDAVLVVDECQNFLNLPRSIDEICAEARGYHLSLVLAHQNLVQLPRETAAAISANCRNKIYFTCSPEDARVLARHTLPELDEFDLSHLDAYTAAARLVINGAETPAFTLATNPPPPIVGSADAIRARCAQLTADRLPTSQPANAQQAGLPPDADQRGRRSQRGQRRRLRPVPPRIRPSESRQQGQHKQ